MGARRIVIEFLGRDTSLSRTARNAEQSTSSLGSRLRSVGKAAALGLGAGLVVAGKAALDMAQAAAVDEESQARLANVMRNVTGANDAQVKSLDNAIQKMSMATGVADDELREAYSGLLLTTKDAATSQELLKVAMDVSAGSGKDLGTVVEALTGAARGEMDAIESLGVKTEDAAGKTLSLKQMSGQLSDMFGGAMKTKTETAAGKMQRLQNQFAEVKEKIGAQLLPVLVKFGDWFLRNGIPAIEKFGRIASDAWTGIAAVIGPLWRNAIKPALDGFFIVLGKIWTAFDTLRRSLAGVPGFEWADTAANKIRGMEKSTNDANGAFARMPKNKNVNVKAPGLAGVLQQFRDLERIVNALPAVVGIGVGGALGRQSISAAPNARMAAGAGDTTHRIELAYPDGKVIQTILLKLKRQGGGIELGIA